jgi:predicted Fe-Mo cluster-binding NifX family protein
MALTHLAVATTDGSSVCDHLARSAAFVILEIENGKVVSRSVRSRGTDSCGQHRSFVELMSGCQTVICGGIGQSAANALAASGIEAAVLAMPLSIEEAAAGYLAGTLVTTEEHVCLCG